MKSNKAKQRVFFHENKRKREGGFTDMDTKQRSEYRKKKRDIYLIKRCKEFQALKDRNLVYKNNWELVTGHTT